MKTKDYLNVYIDEAHGQDEGEEDRCAVGDDNENKDHLEKAVDEHDEGHR